MPKLKTNSGAKKRFKKTGSKKESGEYLRKHTGRRKLLSNKTSKRIRHLRGNTLVHESDKKLVKRLINE